MRLNPEDLKKDTIFYECDYGINVKYCVIEEPRCEMIDVASKQQDPKLRKRWQWQALAVDSNQVVDFIVTEGLEHYGPKIYSHEEYQ